MVDRIEDTHTKNFVPVDYEAGVEMHSFRPNQSEKGREDASTHQRSVEPMNIDILLPLDREEDNDPEEKTDDNQMVELHGNIADDEDDVGIEQNQYRYKVNIKKLKCGPGHFVLILVVSMLAFLTIAAIGMSAYAISTVHTDNVALREKLQQMNQMSLTITNDSWTQLQEFVALEVRRALNEDYSLLKALNYSLAEDRMKLSILKQQLNSYELNSSLSEQVLANQADIILLTANLSNTERQLTEKAGYITSRLTALQKNFTQKVEQVDTKVERLEESLLGTTEDVKQVENRMLNLESNQASYFT